MRRPKEPLLDKPFDYLVDPIARFLRVEFACSVVHLLAALANGIGDLFHGAFEREPGRPRNGKRLTRRDREQRAARPPQHTLHRTSSYHVEQ